MYLEERVEQLETLTIDQRKQSETIAKAVAKLTVDTQQGINELKQGHTKLQQGQVELQQGQAKLQQGQTELQQGQTELRQEVTRLADLSDATNERITQLDRKIDQLEANQVDMRQELTELKVGQELILQILREKLS